MSAATAPGPRTLTRSHAPEDEVSAISGDVPEEARHLTDAAREHPERDVATLHNRLNKAPPIRLLDIIEERENVVNSIPGSPSRFLPQTTHSTLNTVIRFFVDPWEFTNVQSYLFDRSQRIGFSFLLGGDILLRSVSQVFTLNNPVTGLLLLLGLGFTDPLLPLFAVIGAFLQNATAVLICGVRTDSPEFLLALNGYDGVLVGAAIRTFLSGSSPALLCGLLVFASIFAGILRRSLGEILKPLQLPPLTLTFCLVSLGTIVAEAHLAGAGDSHPGLSLAVSDLTSAARPKDAAAAARDWEVIVKGLFLGVGQIIFIGHWIGGVLALVALALASRVAAIAALCGSGLALTVSLHLFELKGTSSAYVLAEEGLLSYNCALTACALASGAVVLREPQAIGKISDLITDCFLKPMLAASVALCLHLVLLSAFSTSKLPVMTLPFVLSVWMVLPAVKVNSPNLKEAEVSVPIVKGSGSAPVEDETAQPPSPLSSPKTNSPSRTSSAGHPSGSPF